MMHCKIVLGFDGKMILDRGLQRMNRTWVLALIISPEKSTANPVRNP